MPGKYYVYQLVDPRNGRPFYIGKGQGKRIGAHEKQALAGSRHPKSSVIRAIWADGMQVRREIIRNFSSEDAAFRFEARLIAKIGLPNLTNIAPGGPGAPWATTPKAFDPAAHDGDWLRIFYKFFVKTDGFRLEPWLRFAGTEVPLPPGVIGVLYRRVCDVIARRGVDWSLECLQKNPV